MSADREEHARTAARTARVAARLLARTPASVRTGALEAIAARLEAEAEAILDANREDRAAARALLERGELSVPLFDRLELDRKKLAEMAGAVRAVAALDDPVGRLLSRAQLANGLELRKVSCPLGVLAAIFESRPDAVAQIASLAIKSGNAAILKGGREAVRSSRALVSAIRAALAEIPEIPAGAVQLLTEREETDALLALEGEIDLIIARGSGELVRHVRSRTRIPVLGHAEGICHVYLDRTADPIKASAIVLDSKMQCPAACNAAETLLVHRDAAPRLLGPVLGQLIAAGVELRGCARTRELMPGGRVTPASESDWRTEHSGPVMNVRIVDGLEEAIGHINACGSHHTDAIVTEDAVAAERFLAEVDSAGVYHNVSTRFADGYRYGLGAEVGISTGKLHARGPVGLDGLVTYKYQLRGAGHAVGSWNST